MFSVDIESTIGQVAVQTTQNKGLSPEYWTERILERLVSVSDNADPMVKAQADAFKDQIEKVVVGLEEAISSEDINNIETATKALNDVLTPLTDKLYSQDQAQAENSTEEAPNDDAENTVDAEYEEVKEEENK